MKRTFKITLWTGAYMKARVLTHIKITAPDLEAALDKAEVKARDLNRSYGSDPSLKADYLLCGGFMRLVS